MSKQPQETQTRKPPVHGMKWIKLGNGKDPEFRTEYILFRKADKYVTTGKLRSKTEGESAIAYSFHDDKTGETSDLFTHYCEIKPPQE